MTGWDILDKFISSFPPIIMALILTAVLAAVVIFIVGFSRHGVNFLKYGFKQMVFENSFEKHFDSLESKIDIRFAQVDAKIMAIETNHFGHLKKNLDILNGVLLDQKIIDNETKARLDNELRGM